MTIVCFELRPQYSVHQPKKYDKRFYGLHRTAIQNLYRPKSDLTKSVKIDVSD